MKRFIWLFLLLPALMLPGCNSKPGLNDLTGLTFERGSGSSWGDQLYISLAQSHILTLRYIPAGIGQLVTLEQIPITPSQWQAIVQMLEQLPLKEKRTSLLGDLFQKQDGSDYRRLTLTYGERTTTYQWPADGELLERLLEQLVEEVTQ